MRNTFALLSFIILSTEASAQILQGGRLPQLPDTLGPNGGLKVECIAGTCTGSGGAATTVVANQGMPDITMQPWEFKLSIVDPSVTLNVTGLLTANIQDSGGNPITSASATPGPNEWGMITRNIPSGVQAVSASGTWNVGQSGTWSISNTGFNVDNFPTTATTSAISVRCVNTAGNAFESCAGGGGAGSDVNIVSIGGNAVTTTMPVSGTVNVGNFPATQAVSGTFWQATQPVSGTFWQATQPVSFGALPAGTNNIGDVDVLSLPSLPTGANAIGSITNTAFGITGSIPAGTNNIGDVDIVTLPALAAGTNNIGDVDIASYPTITKGTQGTTGVSVQNLKDSGRTAVSLSYTATNPTTTDTVVTVLIKNSNGTAAGGAQSITAAASKILRINSVGANIRTTTAATPWTVVAFRMSSTTTCTAASSVVAYIAAGGTAAVAGNTGQGYQQFPDGFELPTGGSFCISVSGNVNTNVITFSAQGFEY